MHETQFAPPSELLPPIVMANLQVWLLEARRAMNRWYVEHTRSRSFANFLRYFCRVSWNWYSHRWSARNDSHCNVGTQRCIHWIGVSLECHCYLPSWLKRRRLNQTLAIQKALPAGQALSKKSWHWNIRLFHRISTFPNLIQKERSPRIKLLRITCWHAVEFHPTECKCRSNPNRGQRIATEEPA